jgi:hypothetical protein
MGTRTRKEQIRTFAGLSDRKVPVNNTNIENVDLLNVEFSERSMKRRNGFEAVHSNRMYDTSVRFNGVDQYARIPHVTTYDWVSTASRVCVHVQLHGRSAAGTISPILTRGDNNTSNTVYFWIDYEWPNSRWQAFAYDPVATSLVSWTVSESADPVNVTRCIEWGPEEGTNNYELRVFEIDGTEVGNDQQGFSNGFLTGNTYDWLVGAGINNTAVFYFANASISEVRMFSGSGEVAGTPVVGRELPYQLPSSESLDNLVGYWRCNDGTGNRLEDISTTENDGLLELEGPVWVEEPALVQGNSGLEFNGRNGGVVWTHPGAATGFSSDVFTAAGAYGGNIHWTFSAQVVFRIDPSTGRIAAGTIIHCGTGATGTPFSVQVVDTGAVAQLQATYTTGPVTVTINLQNSWADRPLRVIANFFGTAGPTLNWQLELYETDATNLGTAVNTVASVGGTGTGVYCVGAKVSTTSWPFTFSNVFRGVIDDVKILRDQNVQAGVFTLNYTNTDPVLFNETESTPSPNFIIAQQLRFNEGFGRALQSEGAYPGGTATLYPEAGRGFRWSFGLVEPEVPPTIRRIRDYRRILPGGTVRRTLLVGSGSTLYEVDTEAGTATIRGGGLPKGGELTSAQYGDQVYIAGPGSQRPVVWDGVDLRFVGIAGPVDAPRLPVKGNGGSGAFVDGTHHLYCTFRNSETGQESLPGPPLELTFNDGSSDERIESLTLPTSSDPQVNQRRVWMTLVDAGAGSLAYLVGELDDNTSASIFSAGSPLNDIDTNQITLDYLSNQEPPAGSIVEIFQDRLMVAGVPKYPTRVYWSEPGQLGSFNQFSSYVDADLDEGDPITGLEPIQTVLGVLTNDGRLAMSPSGNASAPFFLTRLYGDQGAVSSGAIVPIEGGLVIAGERDIYVWDGASSSSISSPRGEGATSIETLIRTGIEDARRAQISAAHHRSRNQVWFAYPSSGATRNDRVLVYDTSLNIWSVYSMSMEALMEVEGSDEQSWIYGGSWGRIYKLDSGDWDGPSVAVGGITDSGTTTTLTHTSSSWTPGEWRGLFVSWYDVDAQVVRRARIRDNTDTVLTFQEAAAAAPANPDPYVIGGVPWHADWHLSFGNPISLKKLRWAVFAGISDADLNSISVKVTPDLLERAYSLDNENVETWPSSETHKRVLLGGLGRSFRIRVGDTGAPTLTAAEPIPSLTGRIEIHALEIEAEETQAL